LRFGCDVSCSSFWPPCGGRQAARIDQVGSVQPPACACKLTVRGRRPRYQRGDGPAYSRPSDSVCQTMSATHEDILIWSMAKDGKQIDAVVRTIDGVGCDLRFLLDDGLRQSQLFQRHTAPVDVVTAATNSASN
jgi:hypothetical protein